MNKVNIITRTSLVLACLSMVLFFAGTAGAWVNAGVSGNGDRLMWRVASQSSSITVVDAVELSDSILPRYGGKGGEWLGVKYTVEVDCKRKAIRLIKSALLTLDNGWDNAEKPDRRWKDFSGFGDGYPYAIFRDAICGPEK